MIESDELIYRRYLAERNEDDFRVLLERHKERLMLFLCSFVHNMEDAEELMLDAYAEAAAGAGYSGSGCYFIQKCGCSIVQNVFLRSCHLITKTRIGRKNGRKFLRLILRPISRIIHAQNMAEEGKCEKQKILNTKNLLRTLS